MEKEIEKYDKSKMRQDILSYPRQEEG